MPVLFLANAFSEKRFREKNKRRSTHGSVGGTPDLPQPPSSGAPQNLTFIADCLTEYSKSQSKAITDIIRKRSASMVTLKAVAYYLQAFADPEKAKKLFALIKSKDFSEGRTSFAGFSNLGRVDSDPSHVDIKSLVAAIDISRFIYCINFIVVTVKNNVHITMSYPNVMYSHETMKELTEAIEEVIKLVLDRYESVGPQPNGAASSSAKMQTSFACSTSNEASCSKTYPTAKSPEDASSDVSFVRSSSKVAEKGDVLDQQPCDYNLFSLPVDDSDDINQF